MPMKDKVGVKVILDKRQVTQKYSSATFLENQKIPLWVDYKPVVAQSNNYGSFSNFV